MNAPRPPRGRPGSPRPAPPQRAAEPSPRSPSTGRASGPGGYGQRAVEEGRQRGGERRRVVLVAGVPGTGDHHELDHRVADRPLPAAVDDVADAGRRRRSPAASGSAGGSPAPGAAPRPATTPDLQASRVERSSLTSRTYCRTSSCGEVTAAACCMNRSRAAQRHRRQRGDRQRRGQRVARCGVARGVRDDQRVHPLGVAVHDLLGDVAAEAQAPERDRWPGRPRPAVPRRRRRRRRTGTRPSSVDSPCPRRSGTTTRYCGVSSST